jgi:Zn-dependent protease
MHNPYAVHAQDAVHKVGSVFGTPLVVKGLTGFPIVQLFTWLVMFWFGRRTSQGRSKGQQAGIAAAKTAVLLGSEWGHNLAHAAAARAIGKPMNAMRIAYGMPLCVYYNINDAGVTPRQHIARSLGGPLFNLLLLPLALLFRHRFAPGSPAHEVAHLAAGTNTFLSTVSLLPLPFIDGGPILKWTFVERGSTIQQADQAVRGVDGVLGVFLSFGSLLALRLRRYGSGVFLALMALAAFANARGMVKEQ